MFKKSSGELYNAWMKKPEWLRWILCPLAILFGLLAFIPISAPMMVIVEMLKYAEYVRIIPDTIGTVTFCVLVLLCVPRGGMFIIYLLCALILIQAGYSILHQTSLLQIFKDIFPSISIVTAIWWIHKLKANARFAILVGYKNGYKSAYACKLIGAYGDTCKAFAIIAHILCGFYALGKTWALIQIVLGSAANLLGLVVLPLAALIAPFYYIFAKGDWVPLVVFFIIPIISVIMYSWGDSITEGARDVV